jgi:hypothetical protein
VSYLRSVGAFDNELSPRKQAGIAGFIDAANGDQGDPDFWRMKYFGQANR